MRRFLKYVALLVVAVAIILTALDWSVTRVYLRAEKRGIYKRLRSGEPREYDFVVVGSSRVGCHVDPRQIEAATGKFGINLTRLGCGSDEMLLLTKLFFAGGNRAPRMFFQVDYSWEETEPEIKPLATAMPYIREPIFREHYQNWDQFPEFYYIPFYRYARFAPAIGFREIAMTLVKDDSKFDEMRGFTPVDGAFRGSRFLETELESPTNPKLEAIIQLCQEHACTPYFFTAPFFAVEGADFDAFLGPKLPNYFDLSAAVEGEQWFRDASHLNRAGAKEFTRLFIETWF